MISIRAAAVISLLFVGRIQSFVYFIYEMYHQSSTSAEMVAQQKCNTILEFHHGNLA